MGIQSLIKDFEAIVGAENVMTDESDLHTYSYDAAALDSVMPGVAIRPTTSIDLGKVVAICGKEGIPMTVRGAGTNLSGGTIPTKGGAVILTGGLSKIIEINEQDMYAVVQPGVVTAKFAAAVAAKGLFYPPDPGSQAVSTLGGNVAENAGGLRGLKYGVTKDYVMGVDFWDTNGDKVITGSKTVKCVTGYNLAALMIGSEGTLGVFDQITLKLIPPVKTARSMMAVFDTIEDASKTVAAIIAAQVVPATLELMDNFTINAVENFRSTGLPTDAGALLLIEVDGHPGQVEDEAALVEDICKQCGAKSLEVAKDAAQRDNIWQARRDALPALAKLKPTCVLEDATVPRSQIPAMIDALGEVSRKFKLDIGTFGHAGDGNLHPTILTDKRNKEEWARVEQAIDMIFEKALALGGTLSGEHGIGLAKSKYLMQETSRATIEYSRKMKAALDPKNILNPGKILPGLPREEA